MILMESVCSIVFSKSIPVEEDSNGWNKVFRELQEKNSDIAIRKKIFLRFISIRIRCTNYGKKKEAACYAASIYCKTL
jgi:hypothetical protein